jgi:hypothetical protein
MDSCGRILCDQLSGILLIRRKSCGSQVRAMFVRTTIQMDCIDRHGSFGILYSSKLDSILQGKMIKHIKPLLFYSSYLKQMHVRLHSTSTVTRIWSLYVVL